MGSHRSTPSYALTNAGIEVQHHPRACIGAIAQLHVSGVAEGKPEAVPHVDGRWGAEDASQRQVIAAPIAGVVVNMESMVAGTAIAPRQALLDIVPENADLVVESRIRPEDINHVKNGAEADVRLTAFKARITPIVTGEVIYVAADSITDKAQNIAYYVARVRVSGDALRTAGDLRLQPGMPAEVFIKTGARTPLEYMLDPALAFLRRAFREP